LINITLTNGKICETGEKNSKFQITISNTDGWTVFRQIVFGRAPPLFGSKSRISGFGERFLDGQYSLVSLLFAVLLTVSSHAQPFVKVGARAPVPHGVGTIKGYN